VQQASTSGKGETLFPVNLQLDIAMKPDFTVGSRVRLTALGASRCMRLADRVGTVVGGSVYANSVSIRFDGNKSSSTLHRDYLEAIVEADAVESGS
jgi:hypothetical protein